MKLIINQKFKSLIALIGFGVLMSTAVQAQIPTPKENINGTDGPNVITTAVPFLTISPDSKAGAMADNGVAGSADAFSLYWNPAKICFAEKDFGLGLAYTPWLRNLNISDMGLMAIGGYYRMDDKQAFGFGLRYFSYGEMQFTDQSGAPLQITKPSDMSLDGSYSLRLSKTWSGAVGAKFIYSNLTSDAQVNGSPTHAGKAFAADAAFYNRSSFYLGANKLHYSLGINFQNLGNKVSYTDENQTTFLPSNLKLGGEFGGNLDAYNAFSFEVDFNKLLVPTPPVRGGGDTIVSGKDDKDIAVPRALIQSFYDAPGGFNEEMQEVSLGISGEYIYNKQFAIRAGYFYEHPRKGDRSFATLGVGLMLNVFSVDFSYLIAGKQMPLANTMRFTLGFNMDGLRKKSIDDKQNKDLEEQE